MKNVLKIEIETETENEMYALLKHVYKEITQGRNYCNPMIECNSELNEGWLVVKTGEAKGKYHWAKEI